MIKSFFVYLQRLNEISGNRSEKILFVVFCRVAVVVRV